MLFPILSVHLLTAAKFLFHPPVLTLGRRTREAGVRGKGGVAYSVAVPLLSRARILRLL